MFYLLMYFLYYFAFYTILHSIPSKTGGVIVLFMSVLIMYFLPSFWSIIFVELYFIMFRLMFIDCLLNFIDMNWNVSGENSLYYIGNMFQFYLFFYFFHVLISMWVASFGNVVAL